MHTQGDISDDNPIILPGDEIARARFGSSVVNIGDVNDDGYEGTTYIIISLVDSPLPPSPSVPECLITQINYLSVLFDSTGPSTVVNRIQCMIQFNATNLYMERLTTFTRKTLVFQN